MYCHIGVLTTESASSADWKHSSGWCDNDAKYKLTRSASDPDIYTLRLTPKSYFGMNDGEKATALAFVMRNSDASKTGRNADRSDIIVPLSRDNNTLGEYISHSYDAEALTVKAENGTLVITPYNKYVFKVFTQANGDNNQTVTSMFFDDDHQSTTSLTDGAYTITRFEGSGSASGHTISVTNEGQGYAGMLSSRVYTFTVPGYTNNINHVEQNVAAQTSSLAKVSSKAEFDAADKGVYYLSPDNTLYLKAEVRSDDRQTSLLIASSATGIEIISNNNSALTLEYSPATSLFSYAIPGSWSDGTLSIYNVSGTQTVHFTGLIADGTIHQVDSTDGLSKGIYIANISATDTKGARAERNIKIVIQ